MIDYDVEEKADAKRAKADVVNKKEHAKADIK